MHDIRLYYYILGCTLYIVFGGRGSACVCVCVCARVCVRGRVALGTTNVGNGFEARATEPPTH